MATPMRTRYRLDTAGGPREVEVVRSSPSGAAPLVVLLGAATPDLIARAEARLARAGFSVVALAGELGAVAALVAAAPAGRCGAAPSSLGVVILPGLPAGLGDAVTRLAGVTTVLPWPAGDDDEALDVLVRALTSRLP